MLRPVDFERDAEAVCRIMAEFDPEPLDKDALVLRWRDNDQAVSPLRMVWEEDGETVGYLNARRWPFMPEGRCLLDAGVTGEYRRRGIGRTLFERGLEHCAAQGWTKVLTHVREVEGNGPERFAEAMGFGRTFSHFESVMDVEGEVDFSGAVRRAEGEGYRFFDWSGVEDSETNRRRLHEVQSVCDQDEPGVEDFGLVDYGSFSLETFDETGCFAEGIFVVEKDGEWVGIHTVCENEGGDTDGSVGFTGVLPGHRGKGLAKALKWKGVLVAKARGWKSLLTHNDTRNASMLAVNHAFGFVNRPGWVHFMKEIME